MLLVLRNMDARLVCHSAGEDAALHMVIFSPQLCPFDLGISVRLLLLQSFWKIPPQSPPPGCINLTCCDAVQSDYLVLDSCNLASCGRSI